MIGGISQDKAERIICDPDECFKYMNALPDRQISIFDL